VVTTPPPAPLVLEKIEPKRNRLSLSYRLGLNITVDFKKLGGFGNPNDPGPDTGSAEDRAYDDGYNRVDSSGNAGGQTWYWGYTDPSSVQGNNMVFHHTSSPSTGVSKDNDDGVNHGIELAYQYEIQRAEDGKFRWGAEGGFGFSRLSIDDTSVVRNEVNEITDTFSVPGGVFVIPAAPYFGTFAGPGPLISSDLTAGNRVRTVLSSATSITGHRKLNADLYLFRVGPYFEYPLSERFTAFGNVGLNMVIGAMEFTYTETVEFNGNVRATRQDSGSESDFLIGLYAGMGISYAFDENWSVFAGAQFQTAGKSVSKEGGKEAVLDMGKAIVVNIGVSYSF
jgi:opacity protein-like surface antigen